jgi:Saxitoxin biosynthesis operon protein SxtJ
LVDKAGRSELRKFGFIVGGIFALISLWPFLVHRGEPRLWALVLACLLIAPAVVFPNILAPFHGGWMEIGHVLGWVNTRIIMAVIFFFVVTPMGWVMRLMRKDPMLRRLEPDAETYRVKKGFRPATHMNKQY